MVQEIQAQAGKSGGVFESFFQSIDAIPGLSILDRKEMPDGTVRLKMEVAPGMPFGGVQFRQINGQWKMESNAGKQR